MWVSLRVFRKSGTAYGGAIKRMPFWPLYIRVVAEDKILVQYFPAVTVSIECGDGIYSEWVV